MLAVVTGGTSGLGFEISKQLILRGGEKVIAIYKSDDQKAEKAKLEINSPNLTLTPLTKQVCSQDEIDSIAKRNPSKRLGEPIDIANIVLFLCSEKSDYITGENINVNGGILLI